MQWYNENNPHAVEWLRNLIARGHLADGVVESKSIVDVRAFDIPIGESCHFFAGIGGWPLALALVGWPSNREVWTGSCPCQPFSGAGQGRGFADERHLWPEWFRLISKHCPRTIFGEQVEGPAGRAWLDLVFDDLEGAGYACGAVVFPAAGVGAPHLRHRMYWVADAVQPGQTEWGTVAGDRSVARSGGADRLADADDSRGGVASGLADAGEERQFEHPQRDGQPFAGAESPLGNDAGRRRGHDAWTDVEWLPCRDGKFRPTQPGLFPLAHGASARVGRLRAYGNAICIPQAIEFIKAFMET